MRRFLLIGISAALAAPTAAQAHPLTTVAVDYRVRVLSPGPRGVEASAGDGGRKLELAVPVRVRLVVLGYAGEPFLRFSPAGVEASTGSPTAAEAGLVRGAATGTAWARLTDAHRFAWVDRRLLPPTAGRARWSIPVEAGGRRSAITGMSWRESRPALWPWFLVGIGVLGLGIAGIALRRETWPRTGGVALALLAGVAATASLVGLALADIGSPMSRWFQVGAVAAIVAGGAALALKVARAQLVTVGAMAVIAVLEGISQLGVLRHAVVLSALPASAARLAVTVAVSAGLAAAILTFLQPEPRPKGR
jgi:hypothetical protein